MMSKSIIAIGVRTIFLASTFFIFTSNSYAEITTPYKISISRTNPKEPVRKSEIMAEVNSQFPGRLLSIRRYPAGGEDCHTVHSMGDDGELRIIMVACTNL